MSVKEVRTSMPSSVEHGGKTGTVIPVGSTSQRETVPKQGTIRGNSQTRSLETYLGNSWVIYEPKVSIEPTGTGSFTAKSPSVKPVSTLGGQAEVFLPVNTVIGDAVTLVDIDSSWDVNRVTVKGNGKKIDGSDKDVYLSKRNDIIIFRYFGTTGWVSNLVSSSLPVNKITDENWPLALRPNESYFFGLDGDNGNQVTLPEDVVVGDMVKLTSINNVSFSQVPVTVKTIGDVKIEDRDEYLLSFGSATVVLEYRGDLGWIITDTGEEFNVLHADTLKSGSFNSFKSRGSHKVNGPTSGFSLSPVSLSSQQDLDGVLDITYTENTVTQEFTVMDNLGELKNTRRFLRTGKVVGAGTIQFNSNWVELSTIPENSRRVITAPSNLTDDLDYGWYYVVDPDTATPDHEESDSYLVEVLSSGLARQESQVPYGTRSLRAWNINKNQWWESYSLSMIGNRGWRKCNANHTLEVGDAESVTCTPFASVTNIWINSEGSQSIHLDCGETLANLKGTKIGDTVTVSNLRSSVKETIITSSVDIIDEENVNIGKGPHTMTGKGSMKLIVSLNDQGFVHFKKIFGVKS